jgi:N utilization substance protein A
MEASFPAAGRIAAQTAKQVVLQRLREAERELVLAEYANRVGDILGGRIERMEPQGVVVSLGRADALMPREEEVPLERYRPNQTLQFFLLEVGRTARGPELILSRSHPNLLRRLFEREVPEIFNGIVEIRAVSREAGSRSKVAVTSRQEGVDPVGSCVGLRGIRIQNIVNELQGEKIDVVQWNSDPAAFIANALSPAQVLKVDFQEEEQIATVVVPDNQLSLAIGREGQNVRLAAKLTGWKIDLKSLSEEEGVVKEEAPPAEIAEVAEAVEAALATEVSTEETVEAPAEVEEVALPVEGELQEAALAEAAEPVAVSAGDGASAAEAVSVVPPEEELLAQEEVEAAPKVEAPGLAPNDDRIWAMPKIVKEPSVLRFAEDIMPERARGRNSGDRGRRDEGERVKGKKSKRARVTSPETEETEGQAAAGGS